MASVHSLCTHFSDGMTRALETRARQMVLIIVIGQAWRGTL